MIRLINPRLGLQEALLTVTARVPDTEQYRDFSDQVKQIARDEFNYTYDEDPVNPFVAAFHEAVLLYAIVSGLASTGRSPAERSALFVSPAGAERDAGRRRERLQRNGHHVAHVGPHLRR